MFPSNNTSWVGVGVHTIAWTSINNLGAFCLGQKHTMMLNTQWLNEQSKTPDM